MIHLHGAVGKNTTVQIASGVRSLAPNASGVGPLAPNASGQSQKMKKIEIFQMSQIYIKSSLSDAKFNFTQLLFYEKNA